MSDSGQENPKYGGCEGPNAEYIKLISSDKQEFFVKRELALQSGTITAMLTGPGEFKENETNEIHFKEISSAILSKVCEYFVFRSYYSDSSNPIPEFVIPEDISMEVLMAANFLYC